MRDTVFFLICTAELSDLAFTSSCASRAELSARASTLQTLTEGFLFRPISRSAKSKSRVRLSMCLVAGQGPSSSHLTCVNPIKATDKGS